MNSPASDLSDRFLWFVRGEQRFAAAMEHLQEVLPLPALRSLPASEPALAGLMVLRDTIVPVFDPCLMTGSTPRARRASASAVVLRLAGRPVLALIAEEVGQVIRFSAHPVKTEFARLRAAFVGEVGTSSKDRTLLLNIPEFAALMGLTSAPSGASLPLNQITHN
jgi:chemotaxis signal transduction protein